MKLLILNTYEGPVLTLLEQFGSDLTAPVQWRQSASAWLLSVICNPRPLEAATVERPLSSRSFVTAASQLLTLASCIRAPLELALRTNARSPHRRSCKSPRHPCLLCSHSYQGRRASLNNHTDHIEASEMQTEQLDILLYRVGKTQNALS